MSDRICRAWEGDGFSNGPEQRAFAGVEYTMSVEFDDDRQHIVVLQQIGNFLQSHQPGEKEWIGAQARKHAECPVRSRCPIFVIHDKSQRLAIRTGQGATLDRSSISSTLRGHQIGS